MGAVQFALKLVTLGLTVALGLTESSCAPPIAACVPGYCGHRPKTISLKRAELSHFKESFPIPQPGKITLLDFWSVSCPPCLTKVMPELESLWKEVDQENIYFVSVNSSESVGKIRDTLMRIPISYPVTTDRELDLKKEYRVGTTLPFIVIVDNRGEVRLVQKGEEYNLEALRKTLKQLLREMD